MRWKNRINGCDGKKLMRTLVVLIKLLILFSNFNFVLFWSK